MTLVLPETAGLFFDPCPAEAHVTQQTGQELVIFKASKIHPGVQGKVVLP